MDPPRRKRLVITFLALAIGATAITAVMHRQWIAERWCIFRFETSEDADRWDLALKLEDAGRRGRRVAEDWYLEKIDSTDAAELVRAVTRLRKMRSVRAIEPLLDLAFRETTSRWLDDSTYSASGEALQALEDDVLPSVIDRLDRVYNDVESGNETPGTESGTVLCFRLLSRLGDRARPAFPAIVRLADSANLPIRMEALRTSQAFGRSIVPVLAEAFRTADVKGHLRIASVFVRLGPEAEEAVPALVEALDHDSSLVRQTAAKALAKIKGQSWHY